MVDGAAYNLSPENIEMAGPRRLDRDNDDRASRTHCGARANGRREI
jgi:hypothetical protein